MPDSEHNLISVVIVTHRRPRFLEACLQSVGAQDYPRKEVVVVVNPADPESETIAGKHGAKLIRTHRNLGAFPAVNLAIANTNGSRVMVVDDDATFEAPDALSRLNEHLNTNPECAIVTCNIKGPCEGKPYIATQRVHVFKNGFALFRREVFSRLAGFVPDTFFRAGGESYLSNYVYEAGFTVMVKHDVWMYHAQTAAGRSSRAMNHYAIRNHALIALIQEPALAVIPSLAAKLLSTMLRIAIQRHDPIAWITGWLSFLGNLVWACSSRRPIRWMTYRYLRKLRQGSVPGVVIVQGV